ncbi:MAG TPA: C10 family peptidase [Bacteroidales bacterium]|nr:C10 family peptidase [Bacteroidales bacterium]HOX79026.1 C10 family peptidase [Bacteroidales bacterium]HPI86056.1 C10 family peptidase [Bacteroidales bacterium]HPM93762.1 C10 family peptidase [Bacteroidales bacterium]
MKTRIKFQTTLTTLITLTILTTLTTLPLTAQIPVQIMISDARTAAGNQLSRHGRVDRTLQMETREIRVNDTKMAYVFDLDPTGYLVIGASSGLPPVIAYSFESDFGQMDEQNPLYTLVKTDLASRWTFVRTPGYSSEGYYENRWESILNEVVLQKTAPLFEQWPAAGDGWLKTNWTQNPPYNNFCPMDPVTGTRSYAGCPATAMAQIMNFHNTTNLTRFDDTDDYYHNYAGRQYWIDDDAETVDFPSFPELNTYLDTLDAHYLAGTTLTDADKAALTFACGTAATQVYTSQGSGTFGVSQAHEAYLRFGCNSVALLDSDDADLFDRLKQNIKDTLPAHLAVVNESWTTGHNVVVDGYNTDDYYHLNFGWGGSYNGWYLLPDEIPYELTVIEGVVVDIMKKSPVGIDESADGSWQSAVRIYPNPATGLIFIELPANYFRFQAYPESKFQISIFGINGQKPVQYQNMEQSMAFDATGLAPGIYFVKVTDGSGLRVGKVAKFVKK